MNVQQAEDFTKTLSDDFSELTEENRKNVIEMTKFLVITQNTVIPELLNRDIKHPKTENNEQEEMRKNGRPVTA